MQARQERYRVLTELVDIPCQIDYEECLYHRQDYLASQVNSKRISFFLVLQDSKRVTAKIHFDQVGDLAISQYYAPFGSLDGDPGSASAAEYLLTSISSTLRSSGIRQVEIRHPASCYWSSPHWEPLLLKSGFTSRVMVNHHLVVDEQPFEKKIHPMEVRKLNKSQKFRFNVHQVGSLRKIYNFIRACREERNQSLSMNYQQLAPVVHRVPNNFLLVSVGYGQELAAAAIIIKVNSACWYQFYPAHSEKFNRESPLVYLISEVYKYACNRGVKIFDLGTSEVQGKTLDGLIKFKTRMGGSPTQKKIFSKPL